MKNVVIAVIAVGLVACGGHQQQPDTTPTTTNTNTAPPPDDSADMLSPEKMDEVQHDLQRKEMIVSECLASAMEAGEVKHGTHGKVVLEIVIENGRATSVKIQRTDIENKGITDCVIKHVTDIAFPQMKHRYETSYTYAMEAN
ncbi:MAG TPA: AgmX/PglI C-terminal domain-containing protein [Kofleriaceae bacterium]|nr:AgmX/PglI C-terminal domain-containing protein [Kofleriaceae bacterium]